MTTPTTTPKPTRLVIEVAGRRIDYGPIAPGALGTSQTLAAMAALASSAVGRPQVNKLARDTMERPTGCNSLYEKLGALFFKLRTTFKYISDPHGVEYIQDPEKLACVINNGAVARGDCDDLATLAAALLATLNIEPAFIVVGRRRGRFIHVLPAAVKPGTPENKRLTRADVVPFDPQEGFKPGRWPPPYCPVVRITRATDVHDIRRRR